MDQARPPGSRHLHNILHQLKELTRGFVSLGESWCDTTADVGRLGDLTRDLQVSLRVLRRDSVRCARNEDPGPVRETSFQMIEEFWASLAVGHQCGGRNAARHIVVAHTYLLRVMSHGA